MNRDRVKRWSSSVRYYKLVRLKKEKYFIESFNAEASYYSFYPKKKNSLDMINVNRITIYSSILFEKIVEKKNKKKNDERLEEITKLKKEMFSLKEKEKEEKMGVRKSR